MGQYEDIRAAKDIILSGTVLAIDPSSGGSSFAGWALFEAGEIQQSGIVSVTPKTPIHRRLTETYDYITMKFEDNPDVVVVERVGGRLAHKHLLWSVGALLAAARGGVMIELSPVTWQKRTPADYVKGDEEDAIQIGTTVIEIAEEQDVKEISDD